MKLQTSKIRVRATRGRRTARPARRTAGNLNLNSFTATEAKNEFGRILEEVIRGKVVMITKHDAPKAVLMPIEEFQSLSRANQPALDLLTDKFDALLERMQTPKVRAAMKKLFRASPKRLGRAAVADARRRG